MIIVFNEVLVRHIGESYKRVSYGNEKKVNWYDVEDDICKNQEELEQEFQKLKIWRMILLLALPHWASESLHPFPEKELLV